MNQETEKAIRKIANFPDTIKRLYICFYFRFVRGHYNRRIFTIETYEMELIWLA